MAFWQHFGGATVQLGLWRWLWRWCYRCDTIARVIVICAESFQRIT
ncbi:MAG: hypothetical protein U7126_30625 [Microcoleus sp.]